GRHPPDAALPQAGTLDHHGHHPLGPVEHVGQLARTVRVSSQMALTPTEPPRATLGTWPPATSARCAGRWRRTAAGPADRRSPRSPRRPAGRPAAGVPPPHPPPARRSPPPRRPPPPVRGAALRRGTPPRP